MVKSFHRCYALPCSYYIRILGVSYCSITSASIFISYIKSQAFDPSCCTMTQSFLLGNAGVSNNGKGTRKRLKISVPHFDNYALIKTYSKTLVGRCINPEEQDMMALLTNLPKIWKLEEKIVGVDLGHGMFQFDFEKEEDIDGC